MLYYIVNVKVEPNNSYFNESVKNLLETFLYFCCLNFLIPISRSKCCQYKSIQAIEFSPLFHRKFEVVQDVPHPVASCRNDPD